MKHKLIRITTVPISLSGLLTGQLKFMSNHYEVIGVSSSGKENELKKFSEIDGISTYPVEMTRKITPIKDVIALYKLYILFKREKPFIVHSHTPKAGTLSMIAAKMANVPHRLHTIAGLPLLEATGKKRILLNLVEKITYRCSTKIYPNSFGLVDIILENKFTEKEKLKVIANGSSNGIDTSYFSPLIFSKEDKANLREKLNIAANDIVFIYVGRLVKDKGVNELIHAFKIISQEAIDCKLLLVGMYENELDPLLPETQREIDTNKNIVFVGWQKDVRPYFSMSNILVFPSYREGFPNVVMQAASMGLVSIVSDINGCNEIIKDGFNGKIIPVKNTNILLENMKLLLSDKNLRNKMAENARESITNRYERHLVWDAILSEYNQLA